MLQIMNNPQSEFYRVWIRCCIDTKGNWIDVYARKVAPTEQEKKRVIGYFVLWLTLYIQF